MKLIRIIDRQGTIHYINPTYIVRIEDHNKVVVIFTSDGTGIRSDMTYKELTDLLAE